MKTFDNHEAQVESGIIDGKMLDFVPTNTYPEFATNSPIPYLSKNKALQDSYEITPSNTVNIDGVILNVDRNTLRTPAVIVDALLAHGEALDCFNMQLQNEGVKETQEKNRALTNENAKQELILETLNAITDPVQRAEAMAKIFYPPASNDSNHTSV